MPREWFWGTGVCHWKDFMFLKRKSREDEGRHLFLRFRWLCLITVQYFCFRLFPLSQPHDLFIPWHSFGQLQSSWPAGLHCIAYKLKQNFLISNSNSTCHNARIVIQNAFLREQTLRKTQDDKDRVFKPFPYAEPQQFQRVKAPACPKTVSAHRCCWSRTSR